MNILVVEDNETCAFLFDHHLRKAGYTVLVAGTLQSALSILLTKDHGVDVVLLDYYLPGVDGKESYSLLSARHSQIVRISGTDFGDAEPDVIHKDEWDKILKAIEDVQSSSGCD